MMIIDSCTGKLAQYLRRQICDGHLARHSPHIHLQELLHLKLNRLLIISTIYTTHGPAEE